jgi:uncharacterized protein DUF5818
MNDAIRYLAVALTATLCGIGCAHTKPGGVLTVKGALESGPECPVVVTYDGRRYSLTGSLGRFKIGDRVCVRGSVAEVSICMAGEATLAVEAIGPENDCPSQR